MRLPISIPLNPDQREIIIGKILGDGYLEFDGFHGTRLEIKQKSKEYVFWLYKKLRNLCRSGPKKRKDNRQWYFSTRFLAELTALHRIFYFKARKIIPVDISGFLYSPLTLAIWYMDDGSLDWRPKDHFSVVLSTDSFNFKEAERLKKVLEENFGVEARVHNCSSRGKRYPKIYIGKKGREKFFSLIRPYILNCFSYKLPPL